MNKDKIKIGEPYIEINSYCNLECKYCYHGRIKQNKELSYECIEKLCFQLKNLGIKSVKISGGEPFFHRNILLIIDLFYKNNIFVNIVTNGTIFNDTHIKYLEKIQMYIISLDSFSKKVNKLTRGSSSYDRIIKTLNTIKKYSLIDKVCLSAVITKYNFNHLDEYVKKAMSFNVKFLTFELIHREGSHSSNYFEELNLTFDELYKTYKEINILREKYINDITIFPFMGFYGGCNLLFDIPVINPRIDVEGNVYICRSLLDTSLACGNINNNLLDEILYSSHVRNFINKMKKRTENIVKCKNCFLNKCYCVGGCFASSYNKNNDFYFQDELCEYRIKFFKLLLKEKYENKIENS